MGDLQFYGGGNPKKKGTFKCWRCGNYYSDIHFYADHTRPSGNGSCCVKCSGRKKEGPVQRSQVSRQVSIPQNARFIKTDKTLKEKWEAKYGKGSDDYKRRQIEKQGLGYMLDDPDYVDLIDHVQP